MTDRPTLFGVPMRPMETADGLTVGYLLSEQGVDFAVVDGPRGIGYEIGASGDPLVSQYGFASRHDAARAMQAGLSRVLLAANVLKFKAEVGAD